jgi:hypothetical protein
MLGGTIREIRVRGKSCTMVCMQLGDCMKGVVLYGKMRKQDEGPRMSEEQSKLVCMQGLQGERMSLFWGWECKYLLWG